MLQRLSLRAEFWIVLWIAFAYPIFGGAWEYIHDPSPAVVEFSDRDFWFLLAYEAIAGGLVLLLLRLRGLPWKEMRPDWSWVDVRHGVGLFFGAVVCTWFAYALASGLPGAADRLAEVPMNGSVSAWVAAFVVLINPLFEEGLTLGYTQQRLRGHGPAVAIGASLLLRLLANLDQGPHAVVGILPVGAVFGIYVWRTGRVWPAVLAHALFDLAGLIALAHT